MVQGRRLVAGIGSGRLGADGLGWWASCSQAAQGGRWGRPANGLGSLVRVRFNLVGTDAVGSLEDTALRLGQV